MSRVADASGSFAEVLRTAIEVRGLGLERIRERLEARGISVSVATLSYWQSGRSQPGRKQSLAALPHLEELLDLDPGSLQRALTPPRERGRRCQVVDLDAVWPEPPQTKVLRSLDTRWDTELERISLHDVVTMGPDRTQVSLQVRQVLRARCDGPDRRVVMHCLEDPQAGPPEIHALRGCRLGSIARDVASGIIGCELVFLEPLRRDRPSWSTTRCSAGRRVPTRCGTRAGSGCRCGSTSCRSGSTRARCPPPSSTSRTGQDCQPLGAHAEHSVHVVDTDCTAGITGVRWVWPDAEPAYTAPELTVNGRPGLVTQATSGPVSAGHSLSGRITHVRTTPPPRGRTPGRDDERRPGARADGSHR